ncbi:uncharacterized protein C12orf40 homolog [Sorex fumeus]|uniref:uncharacterized protein C12orf40 homolog n=1 Tax=Sorex fumeus TaxID=62283 RepID=UPI0024ADD94A|nr:uncharacterized protein C12orf40 homolog [Sorex fumeus]
MKRSRILIKQERRKQKEYFEKKRLKSKMKLLGVLSPVKNSAVSLDLLNLYMVNQISRQRKMPETVRKPIHVNMNKDIKMPVRKQDLELPMSPPRRPSKLCIDDLETKRGKPRLLSNVNYSNSLASKLYDSRDVLSSSYKTVQSGTSFESLNSPGNRDLFGRPEVTSEGGGSLKERRQSDLLTDKNLAQSFWAENAKDAPNFLEYMNQPTPSLLSKNCDSFISPNLINLLNVDQQTVKTTFDCMRGVHAAVSCGNSRSTDSCISRIFTGPELTFSTSTPKEKIYPEKCWSNRTYQREYSNNKVNQGNNPLEEVHPKLPWDFGLGETPMGGGCSRYMKDPGSPESSQSASYSPRQTDSDFSSSSEMLSEDEGSVSQQMEPPERSINTKETPNNVYLERETRLPGEKETRGSPGIQQNDHFHQLSVKNNPTHFSQSQSNSVQVLQKDSMRKLPPQGARCDAGTQTEGWPGEAAKVDVAVQCGGLVSLGLCDAGVQTEGWRGGPAKADVAVQSGGLSRDTEKWAGMSGYPGGQGVPRDCQDSEIPA